MLKFRKDLFIIIISLLVITFINSLIINIGENYEVKYLDYINSIEDKFNNEDYKNTLKEISKVYEEWKNDETILSLFFEHSELEKVSIGMLYLKVNIENEEYTTSYENLKEVEFWLKHFVNKNKVNLKNVL